MLPERERNLKMVVKLIFSIILLIILLALLSPLIFCLAVYKLVANLYLRWRILGPRDIIWELDKDADLPHGIMTLVTVVSGEKYTLPEFKKLFKDIHQLDPKFHCLREHSALGFQYWQRNNNFNLDDHVKGIRSDEVVDEDEFRKILERLSDQKLPLDHRAQWEAYLGPHLKTKDGVNQTVIGRLHHSLGDGPSILRKAMQVFVKREELNLLAVSEEKVKESFQKLPPQGSFYEKLIDIKTTCSKILSPRDENTFLREIPRLNGHMQIAWRWSSELMAAAKSVRKSTGASFSAALVTSFIDALAKHRRFADSSKNITFDFPFQTKYGQKPKLANNYTYNFATFTMPNEGQDILSHLKAVDQCLQKTKSIAVLTVNGFMLKTIGWLCPRPLANYLTTMKTVQVDFSNIPGPEAEFSYGNLKMQKIFCCMPRLENRGIGVTACTYKGVLNLGLNMDTAICSGPNDAEEIMQMWEKQLFQMAQELDLSQKCINIV